MSDGSPPLSRYCVPASRDADVAAYDRHGARDARRWTGDALSVVLSPVALVVVVEALEGDALSVSLSPVALVASSALKWAVSNAMRGVRRIGTPPGFARGMITIEEFEAANSSSNVSIRASRVVEGARTLALADGSDPVPALSAVDTTVSLVDIRDPRYSLRNGYLVDPDRRVVYEGAVVPSFPFRRLAVTPLERPVHRRGTVAWLRQEDNYGHWQLLALPLLRYYREALGGDADFYYLGPTVRSYQVETLAMLGIPEERILREAVTADRLLVAVVDRRGGAFGEGYESESLLFAARSLPPSRYARETPARRRLFVSRAGADRRRLLNEAACMEALDEFGVELVATETLTVVDEIALFGEAELIVGGHGAGLVNCAFAPSAAARARARSQDVLGHPDRGAGSRQGPDLRRDLRASRRRPLRMGEPPSGLHRRRAARGGRRAPCGGVARRCEADKVRRNDCE